MPDIGTYDLDDLLFWIAIAFVSGLICGGILVFWALNRFGYRQSSRPFDDVKYQRVKEERDKIDRELNEASQAFADEFGSRNWIPGQPLPEEPKHISKLKRRLEEFEKKIDKRLRD